MEETKVSAETQNQMNAVKALINVYDLLNLGTYQGNFSVRLKEAQEFVKALHSQALTELQNKEDFVVLMAQNKPTEATNEQAN